MKAEYKELDSEWMDQPLDGHPNEGCEMNFYYLDLTSTAVARVFPGIWANYLIFFQSEDREFAELSDVFNAITISFLRESNLQQTEPLLNDAMQSGEETEDEDDDLPPAHECDEHCDHDHHRRKSKATYESMA